MTFKISGFGDLQRQIDDITKALNSLDGEITTLKYDPDDPSSVETAVAQMEQAVATKIAPYIGNKLVEDLGAQLKAKYRQAILDRAAAARLRKESGTTMNQRKIDAGIFRQIENVITDLQSSEYNTFDRHIKKLSRLLHSPDLENITATLVAEIDIDVWLKAAHRVATDTGMGNGRLEWPADTEKDLGTTVLLIDRFAKGGVDQAMHFAHVFYNNGRNINANLHNMTRQMLVPFARDYINYVKEKTGTPEATLLPARTDPAARKIFIVHGRDGEVRESVARYIEKLGFEPIILHEQASQGRTIIEKIEAHSDVGFAVVLLTPDDVGGGKGDEQQDRARQNVLLELGYFVGRLGRARVCALKSGELELPSDFGGVVYQPYDEGGGWKTALGRELEAAGFEIDWNSAMRPKK